MAHLVIGDDLPLLGVEQPVSLFQTRHDPFDSVAEVRHRCGICASSRRQQRRFVTRLARSAPVKPGVSAATLSASTSAAIFHLLHVNLQDLHAALLVGPVHQYLAVEPAGPQQRGSRISGRLVAARMTSPERESKPSSSTRS